MATRLEIQENTFLHISREIHDNINLSLTLAKLHLNTFDWNDKEKMAYQLRSSVELIGQSISSLSDISKSLHSDIISSQGLKIAIDNEIKKIGRTGLFPISLVVTGNPVYMNVQKELIIFRIVQEAFNNMIKHAKATKAEVNMHYNTNGLQITLHDNGCGFIVSDHMTSNKIGKAGLSNMETRAKAINGNMQVVSSINKGTTLSFYIPY
jgi:signal transduction histidine kinase